MDFFVRCWKGEASLAAAFWLLYILFGLILAIIIGAIFSKIYPDFYYWQYQDKVMSIQFPYTLFSAICVWRCAKNSALIWRVLARIIVVLAVLGGLLNVFHAITHPGVPSTMMTPGDMPPPSEPVAPPA